MSEPARLFQEFAAALQFPYYFGENWIALRECLVDLEWLPAEEYLLIIFDFPQLLQSDSKGLRVLMNILGEVALEWGTPISVGEYWDRPAKPFKVLFHATPEDTDLMTRRCEDCDIDLETWDLQPVEGSD